MSSQGLQGLLEGFGSGFEKVGQSMIKREADAVAQLRAENMARFNADEAMKRTEYTAGQAAARQTDQQTHEAGLLGTTTPGYDKEGNLVTEFRNKAGKVIETSKRPPEKGEPGYRDPSAVKIEASMYKIGLQNVFDKVFSKYSSSLGEDAANMDMTAFLVQHGDGTVSFNHTLLRDKFKHVPGLVEELDTKKVLMENAMERGLNPAKAATYADITYDELTKEQEKKETAKQEQDRQGLIDDVAKKHDIDPSMVKKIADWNPSPEEIISTAQGYNIDDPTDVKELEVTRDANPKVYAELIKVIYKNKPKNESKSTPDQGMLEEDNVSPLNAPRNFKAPPKEPAPITNLMKQGQTPNPVARLPGMTDEEYRQLINAINPTSLAGR